MSTTKSMEINYPFCTHTAAVVSWVTPSLLIVLVDLQHPATVGLTISLALRGSAHTQASPSPDSESVISINTISQLEPSTVEIPLKTYLGDKLVSRKIFNGHCLEIIY